MSLWIVNSAANPRQVGNIKKAIDYAASKIMTKHRRVMSGGRRPLIFRETQIEFSWPQCWRKIHAQFTRIGPSGRRISLGAWVCGYFGAGGMRLLIIGRDG